MNDSTPRGRIPRRFDFVLIKLRDRFFYYFKIFAAAQKEREGRRATTARLERYSMKRKQRKRKGPITSLAVLNTGGNGSDLQPAGPHRGPDDVTALGCAIIFSAPNGRRLRHGPRQ